MNIPMTFSVKAGYSRYQPPAADPMRPGTQFPRLTLEFLHTTVGCPDRATSLQGLGNKIPGLPGPRSDVQYEKRKSAVRKRRGLDHVVFGKPDG